MLWDLSACTYMNAAKQNAPAILFDLYHAMNCLAIFLDSLLEACFHAYRVVCVPVNKTAASRICERICFMCVIYLFAMLPDRPRETCFHMRSLMTRLLAILLQRPSQMVSMLWEQESTHVSDIRLSRAFEHICSSFFLVFRKQSGGKEQTSTDPRRYKYVPGHCDGV